MFKNPLKSLSFQLRKKAVHEYIGEGCLNVREDNMAFFPELNVVFNRIKKSANTSVLLFLDDIANPNKKNKLKLSERRSSRSLMKIQYSNIRILKSCSTIVCVRNPYHRSISGFLDKVASGRTQEFKKYAGFGTPSVYTFLEFLYQIKDMGILNSDPHFYPQVNLMFQEKRKFTKVIKVERLQLDMAEFLEQIGKDPSLSSNLAKPHEMEARIPGKITGSNQRHDFLNQKTRKIIEELYSDDFDVFEY